MADGETEVAAVTMDVMRLLPWCRRLPSFSPEDAAAPGASGKFVARVPKSIHARLSTRAKAEGVSLNTLVLTLIAEGLGRRENLT